MAHRRTPRAASVTRAATPSDVSGSWNADRLRPRQPSVESAGLSPTKVTKAGSSRVTASSRARQDLSVEASISRSVAEFDGGSFDPTTGVRRNAGKTSRNARAGTTGNSYGAVSHAQISQMASGNPTIGLSGTLNGQLQEQTNHQRVEAWRVHSDPANASPDRFLSAVHEESEELYSGKSFGPRHEHGMGFTASREKSFSEHHEGGIAKPFQRQFDRDYSISPHASTPVRLQTPENWPPWDIRARIWYNRHKNTIRSIFALFVLIVIGLLYGRALWENAKHHIIPPISLSDGAMPPPVTVTSHVHAHKTTTVTQIIKETSAIAPRPSFQERRNFFNMEIGAKIDPKLTSITRAPMNLFYSVLAPLSGKWFPGPTVNQADTSLKHWTETGQSWCAASSDLGQGQLQLGISLPFTVRPLAVTLEHQLEHLSFNPSNSARHVELWVESHEDSRGANADNNCGPTPEGMDEFWFCVAKMEFSRFNGEEKYQRIEFRNEHVFTNHFAFRVLDNWGSDHTCLYRIQMHGELKHALDSGAGAGAGAGV
ncbi:hypothetical protein E2P81_ATG03611 [Venturia nashicola]|nr:hypothetical protein E2P81_ATG03611 [Venturia nashicola]